MQIKSKEIVKKPEKFGLYYGEDLDYLFRAFRAYFKYGVYPNGKGLDDQPEALLHDFDKLTEWVGYWMAEHERLLEKPV